MNLSEVLNLKEKSAFYIWSNDINFYTCSIIILVGLISNLFTIVIINFKCRSQSKSVESIRVNYQYHPGYRTSKKYMLAIAISDSLFLISHLIEDIFPELSPSPFYQMVNNYNIMCKLILYMRNSSRMCSSYLVVLYAWERYAVIKAPLKRLRFHKHKVTRNVIVSVFFFSYLVCIYTPFISGLEMVDHTQSYNDNKLADMSLLSGEYECDTKKEYQASYDYIGLAYINSGILLPIIFLLYFNFSIVHVLFTRKNVKFRRTFSLNSDTKSKQTIYRFKSANSLSKATLSSQPTLMKTTSMYSMKKQAATQNDYSIEMKQLQKKSQSYYFEAQSLKKETTSMQFRPKQLSLVKKNLKDSDRATLTLMLLSALFIVLNLPYIVSWLVFYIPYIRNNLTIEQTYFRFSILLLGEIFHILNFSVGFFLYFSVSKLFRKDILIFFKSLNCFKTNSNIFYL